MENLGLAGEMLRISERYRQMTDEELIAIAHQSSELTPIAQSALASELSQRKLKIPPPEQKSARPAPVPPPVSNEPSEYDDDRRLVEIRTVWSVADALQVQQLLDTAGIPFYMGAEKATGVDGVTSKFSNGVSVQIMNVGVPWARDVMKHYEPRNESPLEESPEEMDDAEIRCPRCNSTEIVLDDLIPEPTAEPNAVLPKYKWTCDSCGHEWEDDGIVNKK